MATQWPLLKARMVAVAPTITGWDVIEAVYPGPPPTNPPLCYATVGYTGVGESGSFSGEQNNDGFSWNETGYLHCEITCSTGDEDPLITEAKVFGALDGLQAAIDADRRFGVLPPQSSLRLEIGLAPVQNEQGTGFVTRFALNYFTVT